MLPSSVQQHILSWTSAESNSVSNNVKSVQAKSPARKPTQDQKGHWSTSRTYLESLQHQYAMKLKAHPGEIWALSPLPDSIKYFIRDSFLGDSEFAASVAEEAAKTIPKMKPAGMGRGESNWKAKDTRGDVMTWLHHSEKGMTELLSRIDCIVHDLAKHLPDLNLSGVTSTQLAMFPGNGTRYVKHCDAYRRNPGVSTTEGRKLTCIYYLNVNWKPADGGQLRLYHHDDTTWDVAPELDRLVVFRSNDVQHEVLPTFNNRMAVTVWYYGSDCKDPPAIAAADHRSTGAVCDNNFMNSLPPLLPIRQSVTQGDTIFVSIASYRDSECLPTLQSLFDNASHPERISVGVCLQYNPKEDHQEQLKTDFQWKNNVSLLHVDYREASGPIYARHLAEQLYRNEKYYLQIDSHMRFRKGWDTFLIEELAACPSSKPILTTYPTGYGVRQNESTHESNLVPTMLCAKEFDTDGILHLTSTPLETSGAPTQSLFCAAGFRFSRATALKEVPHDPALQFLFFGEEISMSARLWTHGYDFFAPSQVVVFHLWSRHHRPDFRKVIQSRYATRLKSQATQRVLEQCTRSNDGDSNDTKNYSDDCYSLGDKRLLKEYEKFSGVQFSTRSISNYAFLGLTKHDNDDVAAP